MSTWNRLGPFVWITALLVAGCHSFDGPQVRREHAQRFPVALAEQTDAILSRRKPLGLEDCIELAMEHSLAVQSAAIQRRIAELDRRVAFSNFLPVVRLEAQQTWFDPNPAIRFGGSAVALHDKDFREITWDIQWALFNPATWNLYAMVRQGYEVASLVETMTRQAISLQVTGLYFQVIGLESLVDSVDSRVAAAEALSRQWQAMVEEGLLRDWQADQARLAVLTRRLERHQARRSLRQARAELLAAMGLSPQADLTLRRDKPVAMPAGSLEDLVTEALIHQPSLAIADRRIEIDRERVKLALAGFLPQVMGVARRLDTSDSHQVFSATWMGAVGGVLTVFDGFASLHEYQAAKQRRQASFLQREQTTLTVIIQVIRAWDQVQTAQEQVELAELNAEVARRRLQEARQQQQEGLVPASEVLARLAEKEQADTERLLADIQLQTSRAMMWNLIGRTPSFGEDRHHDAH